jgi:hypothetical protein
MKLLGPSRYPFVGLALAAAVGIGAGEGIRLHGYSIPIFLIAMTVCALALLWRTRLLLTYVFVCGSFLLLHNLRTSDTTGVSLATKLGERPRVIAATGAIVSEPKISENGTASFWLQLRSIELEGRTEPTKATIVVRWKGSAAFGDEFRFFGMAAPIAPARNPGEFDMRSYLARRDIRRILFVRYAEDAHLIRSGGGNPVLRFAQKSRQWLQTTLCQGVGDSPEVKDFISGITLGLRHQSPEDIEEPFQQTGTLHLFAVAGLHFASLGGGRHYSADFVLLCSDGSPRLQCSRRGHDRCVDGRFRGRSKGVYSEQSGCGGGASSVLEHERVVLNRLSTLLCGGDRNRDFGRSPNEPISAVYRPRSFSAQNLTAPLATCGRSNSAEAHPECVNLRCSVGGLVRLASLVFSPGDAGLIDGQFDRCADRVLHSGSGVDLHIIGAAAAVAIGRFQ